MIKVIEHIPNAIGVMPGRTGGTYGVGNVVVCRLEALENGDVVIHLGETIQYYLYEPERTMTGPDRLVMASRRVGKSTEYPHWPFEERTEYTEFELSEIERMNKEALAIPVGNIVDPVKDQDDRDVFPEPAKP